MEFTRKSFAVLSAALLLGTGISFAEPKLPEGMTFENEVKWGIAEFSKWDGSWDASLSAPTEKATAKFESDKLRIGVKLKFGPDAEKAYNVDKINGYVAYNALQAGYAMGYEQGIAAGMSAGLSREQAVAAGLGAIGARKGMATALNQINSTMTVDQYEALIPAGADANSVYGAVVAPFYGTYDSDCLKGEDYYYISWKSIDYWLEYSPVDCLSLGFHNNVYADGSYLPLWDDNVSAGNMGSDGFTVTFKPLTFLEKDVGKLNLAFTVPFTENKTWIMGDDSEKYFYLAEVTSGQFGNILSSDAKFIHDQKFNFGLGAEYKFDGYGAFGIKLGDVADNNERTLGFYGSMGLKELAGIDLKFNLGFATAFGDGNYISMSKLDLYEASGIMGDNILNASVEFKTDRIKAVAEMATNFGKDYDNTYAVMFQDGNYYGDNLQKLTKYFFNREYDHYIACSFDYGITEKVSAGLKGNFLINSTSNSISGSNHSFLLGFQPNVSVTLNEHHALNAGITFSYGSDEWIGLKMPVTWKYKL